MLDPFHHKNYCDVSNTVSDVKLGTYKDVYLAEDDQRTDMDVRTWRVKLYKEERNIFLVYFIWIH